MLLVNTFFPEYNNGVTKYKVRYFQHNKGMVNIFRKSTDCHIIRESVDKVICALQTTSDLT